MSIKRDVEFLFEIGCFRFLSRSWKRFLNPDFANNAEHTLRVIWISLILAEYEKVKDHGKIIKIALVHDLTESRCGDVDYLSRQYVERQERKAIEDICQDTVFDKEMINLWREYEKRQCLEAKIVKDADNLDVELELREQKERGSSLKESWKKNRRELVYPNLYTKSAKQLWNKIETANPHDWHLKGRNRFIAGDWQKNLK